MLLSRLRQTIFTGAAYRFRNDTSRRGQWAPSWSGVLRPDATSPPVWSQIARASRLRRSSSRGSTARFAGRSTN